MTRLHFALLLAVAAQQSDVFPVFHGKIRELTRSKLVLEVDDGNLMEFRIQKRTRFYRGDKDAKPSQFQVGNAVSVEGKPAPDASLDAVSVRAK